MSENDPLGYRVKGREEPVTRGEMLDVIGLVLEYATSLSAYSVRSLGGAITGKDSPPAEDAELKRVREILQELKDRYGELANGER